MKNIILKNRLLKNTLTVLHWCSFVTFEKQKLKWFIKIKPYILLAPYIIYISTEIIMFLFRDNDQVTNISINSCNILFYTSISIKASTFIKYRKQFSKLFSTVDKNIRLIESCGQEENKILDNHIKHCKIIMWILHANALLAALFCVFFYIFICFLSQK